MREEDPAAGARGVPAGAGAAEPGPPGFDHGDPGAYYRALREAYGDVAPVLLDGGLPAWLVLGYREVREVAGSPETFGRDPRRWHAWGRIPDGWPLLADVAPTASVVFTEGAEHQRRSGVIAEVLAGVDPFEVRAATERVADAAVDRFAGAGRAELMAEYAELVPLRVMAGLFGLRDDETAALERADADDADADAVTARATSAAHTAHTAHTSHAARAVMAALLERLRHRPAPGADLPSRLLAHPAGLSDEEVVEDLVTLMSAACGPTANWVGNTLRLMLTDERFALTLSGGRRSVGQALTHVLWTDTPTQNVLGRWATRDTRLGGRDIRRGDCLVLGLAAANADPQAHPGAQAGTAPAAAGNQAHLSFSHGTHGCPAPAPELAEVIATAAVEVLLDRLPDLAPAVPPDQLRWRSSLWQRGPAALPVVFTPV
jgi:cytochrome P450